MKYFCICTDCFNADKNSVVWAVGEIQADLVAICRCPIDHVTICGLMHDLFDVLFTSGILAYTHGFFSESVMSFTASLERAFELFIRLNLAKAEISLKSIDSFWNEIKNQSERQYGSFCSAYLMTTNEIWKADQKQISFRNNVIHKGYIATSSEAKKYAEYILKCLNKIMKNIKEYFSEQRNPIYFDMKELTQSALKRTFKENPSAKFANTSMPSLLKWNDKNHKDLKFEEILVSVKELQEKYKFPI